MILFVVVGRFSKMTYFCHAGKHPTPPTLFKFALTGG